MKTYYTIYKITNTINEMFYIGKHETNCLEDDYMGSGTYLRRAIEKYGRENFAKEVLYNFETKEEMDNKEVEIVNEEFVGRGDTYNLTLGGEGSWYHCKGKITVKDKTGNIFHVDVNDPRYVSGDLKGINCGWIVTKDKFGNCFRVKNTDNRLKSGELMGVNNGVNYDHLSWVTNWKLQISMRVLSEEAEELVNNQGWEYFNCKDFSLYDENGNRIPDQKYVGVWELVNKGMSIKNAAKINGHEYTSTLLNEINRFRKINGQEMVKKCDGVSMKDPKTAETFRLHKDDPRIREMNLVGHCSGMATVINHKTGESLQVPKDDPRILKGELVSVMSGRKWITNIENGKRKLVYKYQLDDFILSGKWIIGRKKNK